MGSLKEVYFDKEIKINVANNTITNGSLQSVQHRTLRLLLELHTKNSPGSSKELLLQLTDEADPLILLSTAISEGSYLNLRSSQGLLVDFNSFPLHLLDLIRKCVEEQEKDSPKFALVLRTTGSELPTTDGAVGKVSFEVVELNAFKHLCHLSLNLTPASLQTKLGYLSSCIKSWKIAHQTEKEKRQQENAILSEKAQELQQRLTDKEKEIDLSREEIRRKINLEEEKSNNLLMREKEINLKSKSDFDRRLARERREFESKLSERTKELKSENAALVKRSSDLSAKNKAVEEALRKAKSELKELDEKLKRQSKNLNNLVYERDEWDKDSVFKREQIKKMEVQIAHQERYIQEKEKLLQKSSNHVNVLSEEKAILENKLESCLKKLDKRENSIQQLFMEFQKSLDVLKQFKERLKVKELENASLSKVLEKNEITLEERGKELEKLKQSQEESLKKMLLTEAELEDVKCKLNEANLKIREQENSLKTNENVIALLNKQFTEMESLGAVMKRAPLAEAYLHPQSSKGNIESTSPSGGNLIRTTSTPASFNPIAPPNFMGSAQSKIYAPKTEATLNGIPKLPENFNSCTPDNKENLKGLDARYLEPSSNSLPVRGILRANAVRKQDPNPKTRGISAPLNKGQKKSTKPSAYFSKKS